jgi:signal transduction histidine kinase
VGRLPLMDQILDAAVHSIVTERCQRSYMHDIRGGLQAISGAFELLARLAKSGVNDPGMVERASTIAKRAVANHETAVLEMVRQMTAEDDDVAPVGLGELLEDTIRFLRNDIASKQLQLSFSRSGEFVLQVQKRKLRLILLGLIALCIDDSPAGGELTVRLDRSGGDARIEMNSAVAQRAADPSAKPPELVLDMARQWLGAHGGRLELRNEILGRSELKIYYPLPV